MRQAVEAGTRGARLGPKGPGTEAVLPLVHAVKPQHDGLPGPGEDSEGGKDATV